MVLSKTRRDLLAYDFSDIEARVLAKVIREYEGQIHSFDDFKKAVIGKEDYREPITKPSTLIITGTQTRRFDSNEECTT